MAEPFDPYFFWLGIPPEEQPANRYRLLGVPLFVNNPDVIDNAADQRTAHLRTYQSSKNGKLAEQLLNEVATARICLLDAKKKAAYDDELRAKLAAQSPSPVPIATQPAASGSAIQRQPPRRPTEAATATSIPTANRGASSRNISIGVGAGVVLIAALAFGIHALSSPSEGTLVFDWPDRADVVVTVDDAPIEAPAAGSWEQNFPAGPHHVAAQRPAYKFAADVDLAAGQRLSIPPDWKPKAVLALSWPAGLRSGAVLKIDGRVQSISQHDPLEVPVEPGAHTIQITRPGFDSIDTSVVVAADGRELFAVAAPPAKHDSEVQSARPDEASDASKPLAASNPPAPEAAKPETPKSDVAIKIDRARWGGGNNWVDVTQRVQETVDRHETVWASPDFLKKDPTPGWRKHLQITIEKDGHRRSVNLDEGRHWTKEEYEADKKHGKIASGPDQPSPPTSVATQKNPPGPAEQPAIARSPAAPNPAAPNPSAQPNQVAGQPTKSLETPPPDQTEISLPGNVSNVVVGGGGRFLILHLAQVRKLAIFDVNAAKIVKYIPLPEDEICFTAGIDKLIVGLPQANAFQRWSLQTMEREVTVPNPLHGTISDVVMGSASAGPLLVNCAGANALLNPRTFRELRTKPTDRRLPSGAAGLIRASADGTLFVMREGRGGEGHTMGEILIHGDFVSVKSVWMNASLLVPSHDARYVYSADGVYSPDLTRLYPKQDPQGGQGGQHYVPADEGDLILHLVHDAGKIPGRGRGGPQKPDSAGDLEVMLPGQYRPICTLRQVPGVVHDNLNYGGNAAEKMNSDKRLHLNPRAKLLISIPTTNDKLVLRHFDLDELLAESGTDHLFVASMPSLQARPGEMYKYELEVKSRKGGVKTKLESGPEGMKLSAEGKLTWPVPKVPAEQSVDVIVSVSDSTEQEIFQSFQIQVSKQEVAGNTATAGESDTALSKGPALPKDSVLPARGGATPPPGPERHALVSTGKFRLTGSQGPLAVIPGRDAKSLLVLQQDRLAILGPDGITIQKQVKLPKKYAFLAEREKYYVAIAAEPQSIDLIDKSSLAVLKSLKMPGMGATDLALHPTQPLAYVAYKAAVEIPRFRFLLYDEKSGEAHELDHCIGKWLQVSPDGSFLIAGYSDIYERGQQLVVNPDNMFFVPEYGSIDWLIRYDLKDPALPVAVEKQDKAGGNGGGLRMSADGKRLTYLSHVGYPMYSNNLGGWDPTDLHKLPPSYGTKDVGTPLELAYHPVLPVAASFGKSTAVVFDRETGDLQPDRVKLLDDDQLEGNIQRIYFTPDGRHLLFDAVVNQIHYLVQAELKLTPAELKQLASPPPAPKPVKKAKTA